MTITAPSGPAAEQLAGGRELWACDLPAGSLWRYGPGGWRRDDRDDRDGGGRRFRSVASAGDVYVALAGDCITRWSAAAGASSREARSGVPAGARLACPLPGGAMVATDQQLIEIDGRGAEVWRLTLPGVRALAADSGGRTVAAAVTGANHVVVIDTITRARRVVHAAAGVPLRFPRGVAFHGRALVICDTENRRVVAEDGRAWDLSHRPGFPVGVAEHHGELWVALPYEHVADALETVATTAGAAAACFYPLGIARIGDEVWTTHPAAGTVVAHGRGGRRVVRDRLADPIAVIPVGGGALVAERDGARLHRLGAHGGRGTAGLIDLPAGSQPRALTVAGERPVVLTQTPPALWTVGDQDACRLAEVPDFLAEIPDFGGAPRAVATFQGEIVVTTDADPRPHRLDLRDGRWSTLPPLPEPAVALATSCGGQLLAGLDRAGELLALPRDARRWRPVVTGLTTPRGLCPDGDRVLVAESLAHRFRAVGP